VTWRAREMVQRNLRGRLSCFSLSRSSSCTSFIFCLIIHCRSLNSTLRKSPPHRPIYLKVFNKGNEFLPQTHIFWSQYLGNLMVQTFDILNLNYFICISINSLIYLRSSTLGYKDTQIRKSEFVAKTQLFQNNFFFNSTNNKLLKWKMLTLIDNRKLWKLFPFSFYSKRNWVFATNSNLLISISLQPDDANRLFCL